MLFSTWLRNWKRSLERQSTLKQTRRRRRPIRQTAARPRLEALEDRTLLSPYIVTTTADTGAGSLRDAITQINGDTSHTLYASPSNPNVDEIDFNITAASDAAGGGTGYNATTGVATIKPSTAALPQITNSVILDGSTQPGYSGKPLIELNGSSAGSSANGLSITADNSTVRGLVIDQFGQDGIYLSGSGDVIQGNYIGTDVSGNNAQGNGNNGVDIVGGSTTALALTAVMLMPPTKETSFPATAATASRFPVTYRSFPARLSPISSMPVTSPDRSQRGRLPRPT